MLISKYCLYTLYYFFQAHDKAIQKDSSQESVASPSSVIFTNSEIVAEVLPSKAIRPPSDTASVGLSQAGLSEVQPVGQAKGTQPPSRNASVDLSQAEAQSVEQVHQEVVGSHAYLEMLFSHLMASLRLRKTSLRRKMASGNPHLYLRQSQYRTYFRLLWIQRLPQSLRCRKAAGHLAEV